MNLITIRFPRSMVRRFHTVVFGILLLLCGAVSYSSWEPPALVGPSPQVDLSPRHPWVALTFDDGPHPIMTERLLDMLRDQGVSATFFVVGKMAVRYPRILREIARQGHEIANHTFSHPNIARLDNAALLTELAQTRSVIQKLTGQDTMLYRPPGGDYSRQTLHVASKAGYHMILWTVLTRDVNGATIESMRHRILNGASDGAIILMHSGIPNTVDMLPEVIAQLRLQGYHFVTVSQLLGYDRSHGGFEPAPVPYAPVHPIVSNPTPQS